MKLLSKWLKTKRFWLIFSVVIFCIGITAGGVGISAHIAKNKASDFKSEFMVPVDNADTHANVSTWDGSSSTIWSSGSGTSSSPYLIQSAANLKYLSANYSSYSGKYFKQTVDINLNSKSWTPINASTDDAATNYNYYYDGGGHTISNLYINTSSSHAGVFGNIKNGYVKNLGIESGSVTMTGNERGAAIVGQTGSSVTISNCYNKASVTTPRLAGGIVGFTYPGTTTVSNCYNMGTITTSSDACGGIVGAMNGSLSISYCYNIGTVSGSSSIGGIWGKSFSGTPTISYCYCLSGQSIAGGSATTSNCGTVAKCTSNGSSPMSGFTTSNWIFRNGSYPELKWGSVAKPTQAAARTYTGSAQTINDSGYNTDYMTRGGTYSATNAGTYTATYTITKPQYYWSDSDYSLSYTLNWTINRAALSLSTAPTQSGTLTYNTQTQSPTWSASTSGLTLGGTYQNQTDAGTYTATFTPDSNHTWSGGGTDTKSSTWTIGKKPTDVPSQNGTLTFTKDLKQNPNWGSNYDTTLMTLTEEAQEKSGTYSSTFTLRYPNNYQWSNGNTSSEQKVNWTIDKRILTIPTLSNLTFTYTGSEQGPTVENFDATYEDQSGSTKSTIAGSYTVTFSLKYNSDTVWTDQINSDKSQTWTIERAQVAKPTATPTEFDFNGEVRQPIITGYNGEKMIQGGIASAINAGEYVLTFTPNQNYQWTDGGTSTHSISWIINKITVKFPTLKNNSFEYTGDMCDPQVSEYNQNIISQSGASRAKDVGNYTITFNLLYPSSSQWDDGTVDSYSVGWVITKASVNMPTAPATLTYNGSSQSPDFGTNFDSSKMTKTGDTSGINAGVYVTAITPTQNYQWSDGTSATLVFKWEILRLGVETPSVSGTYTYTGRVQTVALSNYSASTMELTGVQSATEAGTYVVSIMPDTNHKWASTGGIGVVQLSWTIKKQVVDTPTLVGGTTLEDGSVAFAFTSLDITPTLNNFTSTYMEKTGAIKGKRAFTYYMIVSINDANKNNYVFANGRDFVVITWTITPYELTDENTTITTGK